MYKTQNQNFEISIRNLVKMKVVLHYENNLKM